jgi:hypothetical protein
MLKSRNGGNILQRLKQEDHEFKLILAERERERLESFFIPI